MSTRIAFVTSAEEAWGAEQSLRTIMSGMIGAGGMEITTIGFDTAALEALTLPAVPVVRVPSRTKSRLTNLVRVARELWRLRRKFDIIVVGHLDLAPLVAMRWLRFEPKFVFDLHDYPHKKLTQRVLRHLLRRYHLIITITHFNAQCAKGNDRVEIIPRPLPLELTEAPSRDAGTAAGPWPPRAETSLTIGVVGRIHSDKRYELAIEAAALSDSFLMIYGVVRDEKDPYLNRISALMRLKLGDRARMLARSSIQEILETIDILVVCNDAEPFGRTVMEAKYYGTIVIVPDSGGAAEQVRDGVDGFRYRAGSPASLAAAIGRARAMSAREYHMMLEAAREAVVSAHSADRVSLQYGRALRGVAEGDGRSMGYYS